MSDHPYIFVAPARDHIPTMGGNDLRYHPDVQSCKFLGEVAFSRVCGGQSLEVYRDNITKMIFWGEFTSEHRPCLSMKEEAHYGLYALYRNKWEQFQHYIMGYGSEFGCDYSEDRTSLLLAIEKVIDELPCEEWMSRYHHSVVYHDMRPICPWDKERDYGESPISIWEGKVLCPDGEHAATAILLPEHFRQMERALERWTAVACKGIRLRDEKNYKENELVMSTIPRVWCNAANGRAWEMEKEEK